MENNDYRYGKIYYLPIVGKHDPDEVQNMLNSKAMHKRLYIPNGKLDFPVLHVGDYAIHLFSPNTYGEVFLDTGAVWTQWVQSLGYSNIKDSLEFIVAPVLQAESNIQKAFGRTDHLRMLVEKEGMAYVDSIGKHLKRLPENIYINACR
jgi:hypothetical protein